MVNSSGNMVNFSSDVHLKKANFSMTVTVDGMTSSFSEMQQSNESTPKYSKPSGSRTSSRLLQASNAIPFTFFNDFGNFTFFRFPQNANEVFPISVTVSPILTSDKDGRLLNAESPMIVIPSAISNLFIEQNERSTAYGIFKNRSFSNSEPIF